MWKLPPTGASRSHERWTWFWSSSASGPRRQLAADAGITLGAKGAIAVDKRMRPNLPNLFAAGDCVVTHHRLLGESYLPLGTTAHKQGRIAGENALGGD